MIIDLIEKDTRSNLWKREREKKLGPSFSSNDMTSL
jgi:hypothetical protein